MKNSIFQTKTWVITVCIMVFVTINKSFAQTTNFSGTWKRNDEKTKAEGVDIGSLPQLIKIRQDSHSITINRIAVQSQDEKSGYTEVLKFDGSATETITPSKLKRRAVIKSSDQKGFTETYTSKDDQDSVKQTCKQTWILSDDGKTLTILADLTVGDSTFQMNETYDKQ